MATDFRFNGQQSYSPLLSALAEAPANRAKLDILQQQNQRERLSSLLSQMSDAAKVARQVQIQGAINSQAKLAGGPNSVGGSAATINPEGFAGIAGQLPATMQGLNAAFPSVQPQQGTPVATQSQTPGSVPISNQEGVVSPDAVKNKFVMRTLFGEPKQVTEPNSGNIYDSYGPDMNVPVFGGTKSEGVSGKPQLPPKLMEAANTAKEKFQSRADVVTNISDLNLLDQIEAGVKSDNPAAVQNTIIERARTGGLPGGRVTSGTQAAEVGSQQFGAKIGRYWNKVLTGKLTASDKADYLDQIQNQRNVSAKQIIDAHASTAKEVSKQYGIALPVAKKIVASGLESQMGKYNPDYKPLYHPDAGMTKIQASDGSLHMIPSNNLSKAKKIDPKLKVIQ